MGYGIKEYKKRLYKIKEFVYKIKEFTTTFDFIIYKESLDSLEEVPYIIEATVIHKEPDTACDSSDIDYLGYTQVDDIEIFDGSGKKVSNKVFKELCEEFDVYNLALVKFEDMRRSEELFECYMNDDLF